MPQGSSLSAQLRGLQVLLSDPLGGEGAARSVRSVLAGGVWSRRDLSDAAEWLESAGGLVAEGLAAELRFRAERAVDMRSGSARLGPVVCGRPACLGVPGRLCDVRGVFAGWGWAGSRVAGVCGRGGSGSVAVAVSARGCAGRGAKVNAGLSFGAFAAECGAAGGRAGPAVGPAAASDACVGAAARRAGAGLQTCGLSSLGAASFVSHGSGSTVGITECDVNMLPNRRGGTTATADRAPPLSASATKGGLP